MDVGTGQIGGKSDTCGALQDRRETVPVPVDAAICAAALHGLHAAHEAKGEDGAPLAIVHRDVSPQNILLGADGSVRPGHTRST